MLRANTAHMVNCDLWRVSVIVLIIHDAINRLPVTSRAKSPHARVKQRFNLVDLSHAEESRVNEGFGFYTSLLITAAECCIRVGGGWLLNAALTGANQSSFCYSAFSGNLPRKSSAIKCIEWELINIIERTASIAANRTLLGLFCSVCPPAHCKNPATTMPFLHQTARLISPYIRQGLLFHLDVWVDIFRCVSVRLFSFSLIELIESRFNSVLWPVLCKEIRLPTKECNLTRRRRNVAMTSNIEFAILAGEFRRIYLCHICLNTHTHTHMHVACARVRLIMWIADIQILSITRVGPRLTPPGYLAHTYTVGYLSYWAHY